MQTRKVKIIAEIGNSHEGSLGIALSMVDMAVESGADLVKFQFHMSDFESTRFEPFRVKVFSQDSSRSEYWDRVNFNLDQWKFISNYCKEKGIEFFCSPFSIEAAKVLHENNLVKRWKLGSGEITNFPLIEYLFDTKRDVLISTGLSRSEDIHNLLQFINHKLNLDQLVLMHCVSIYPTELKFASFNLVKEWQEKYKIRVGHSDHSGNLSTSLFALTLPIEFLEVHLTPHKKFFGPDTSSSLTPEELHQLVKFNRDLTEMSKFQHSRDELFELSKSTAKIFRKSLYWASDLPGNHIIDVKDVIVRKPWSGLDASEIYQIVGKKVKFSVKGENPIHESEIEL